MHGTRVNEIIVTFSDVKRLVMAHCRFVIITACAIAVAVGAGALILPVEYSQQARLCILNAKSLSSQFTFNVDNVVDIMTSQSVVQRVVEQLGLQVHCLDAALGKRLQKRCLGVDEGWFEFRDVQFSGRASKQLFLRCADKDVYALLDAGQQVLAEGKVGQSLQFPGGHLTLMRRPSSFQEGHLYTVNIYPLADAVSQWNQRLKISAPKLDKTKVSIKLGLKAPDQFTGEAILQTWVSAWIETMKATHDAVYEDYLSALRKKAQTLLSIYHQARVETANYLRQHGTDLSQERQALLHSNEDWEYLSNALDQPRLSSEEEIPVVDIHFVPCFSQTSQLAYQMLCAFVFSCTGLYVILFFRALFTGFPLSETTLKLWKLPVLGTLRRERRSSIEALQALVAVAQEKQCRRIALVQGGYVQQGPELAALLSKRGHRTLLIEAPCRSGDEGSQRFSLQQFAIESWADYDRIVLSENVDIEELCSVRFQDAVNELSSKYQFVVIATQAKGSHIEGQLVSKWGDMAMVVVGRERAKDVERYFPEAWHTGRIQFLCVDV
jgi:hypothetical protein